MNTILYLNDAVYPLAHIKDTKRTKREFETVAVNNMLTYVRPNSKSIKYH